MLETAFDATPNEPPHGSHAALSMLVLAISHGSAPLLSHVSITWSITQGRYLLAMHVGFFARIDFMSIIQNLGVFQIQGDYDEHLSE